MKQPLLLTAPVLMLLSCNRHPAVLEKSVTPVHITVLQRYTPAEGQRYSASITPRDQVNLAFRVNGFVEWIAPSRNTAGRKIDIGDVIEKGSTLARIRTKDYEYQVSGAESQSKQARDNAQAAQAQLAQAQAAAAKAEQDFGRAQTLFTKNSLTKPDYDSAKANFDSTRAQVQAAQAQVAATGAAVNTAQANIGTAKLGLTDTSLIAPFTGVVVQRSVDIGTLAGPGLNAFVLADVSSVKATFAVSDLVVGKLREGSRLSVYSEAFPDRQFAGVVTAIAGVADSTTRSFQVEVTIPNSKALLRPGMIASLDAGARPTAVEPDAVLAPLNAIVRAPDQDASFAVVLVQDGVAHRRPVKLGATYGDQIAVSGVAPGARVVSSGATFVSDGEAVTVIP